MARIALSIADSRIVNPESGLPIRSDLETFTFSSVKSDALLPSTVL